MPGTLELDLDNTDMTFTWVNEPPVRKLERGEIAQCGRWLCEANRQIEAHGGDDAWRGRLRDGAAVAGSVGEEGATDVYAYIVSGKPVGLMQLGGMAPPFVDPSIEFLSGHPLARNAGDILIEFAVNLSQDAGQEGELSLDPVPGAERYYESLGFRSGMTSFVLFPAESNRWSFSAGRWTLSQDHGPAFLA